MRDTLNLDTSKLLGFDKSGNALFKSVQSGKSAQGAEASAAGDVKLVGIIKD